MRVVDNLLRLAAGCIDRLFPARCVLCSGRGAAWGLDLCSPCRADLPLLGIACERCAWPLAADLPEVPLYCGRCLRRESPVTNSRIPFHYAWPVHRLLLDLKFGGRLGCARILGTLLADYLLAEGDPVRPDIFCPVPLGRRRYLERGFNQSLEIGRTVESRTGVPMRAGLVSRIRETPPQVSLDARARRVNVRQAFAVRGDVTDLHVAILDDVVTTGSTVLEIARQLRGAGAARVDVWGVARAARRTRIPVRPAHGNE